MDPNDDTLIAHDAHLATLGPRFMAAIEQREKGRVDRALDELRAILKIEPRLPEPRMELSRIYLEQDRLDDAEAEIKEAIRLLELGGQWIEDVPESVVLSLAWALLGEILKEQASTDEVVFSGDEERFTELLKASRAAFSRAHALDPSDTWSKLAASQIGESLESGPDMLAGPDNGEDDA